MASTIVLRNEERDQKDLGKFVVDGKMQHIQLGSSDDLNPEPGSPFRPASVEITQETYKELLNPKRVGSKAVKFWLENRAISASGALPKMT